MHPGNAGQKSLHGTGNRRIRLGTRKELGDVTLVITGSPHMVILHSFPVQVQKGMCVCMCVNTRVNEMQLQFPGFKEHDGLGRNLFGDIQVELVVAVPDLVDDFGKVSDLHRV